MSDEQQQKYPKVKRIDPDKLRDLKEKNETRAMHGLRALAVKVRTCLACGGLFESIGDRTCGCTNKRSGW